MIHLDTSDEQTALEKDIGMFVQQNKAYYAEQWQNLDNGKLAFNVIAFFLPIFWLGYRRMYRHIGMIALMYLVIDIGLFIFISESSSLNLLDSFYTLGIGIFYGLFANKLYKKHVQRRVNKIRTVASDEQEKEKMLQQQGGGSGYGVLGAIVMIFLIYTIPTIIITYIV